MSWLYSRAVVVDYLRRTFSDGGPFAALSEKNQPDGFLFKGKTMEHCCLSRYGMTFVHLTENRGVELLTSCLEVSHVKPIPQQLVGKTLRTISGRKCDGSWQMSLPGTFLQRTLQTKPLTRLAKTSSRWVTKPKQFNFPRKTWVQTTFGQEVGYLHTPTTQGNYCADSMQKHPSCRAWRTVFGVVTPEAQEYLMGWPQGWSDLKGLEMDRFQSWLSLHFTCLPQVKDAA